MKSHNELIAVYFAKTSVAAGMDRCCQLNNGCFSLPVRAGIPRAVDSAPTSGRGCYLYDPAFSGVIVLDAGGEIPNCVSDY
jgi:hypothetical protein